MPWFIGLQLCFYCGGGIRLAAVLRHSQHCLISLSFSFVFTPVTESFHLLIISLSSLWFFLLYAPIFQSLLIFLSIIFPLTQLLKVLNYLSSLTPSNRLDFPSASDPNLPTPLHFMLLKFADSYLSMSIQLPSLNLFPCHSPRQERPTVSSLSGHKEKLARRSDNPLTPHLSSVRGKAPS